MRAVQTYKMEQKEGDAFYSKTEDRIGLFHQWGTDYEEFSDSAGLYSTAIIELATGEIITPPADMIKFLD